MFGEYAFFIIGSYLSVFVVVGGLIGWIYWDENYQKRLLDEMEDDGSN